MTARVKREIFGKNVEYFGYYILQLSDHTESGVDLLVGHPNLEKLLPKAGNGTGFPGHNYTNLSEIRTSSGGEDINKHEDMNDVISCNGSPLHEITSSSLTKDTIADSKFHGLDFCTGMNIRIGCVKSLIMGFDAEWTNKAGRS